jgi:hypothetical protein
MATLVRAIIEHWATDDVPADYCSHTVYHQIADGIVWGDVDFQNHANELRDLFFAVQGPHIEWVGYHQRHGLVKVYNMGDAKPRPIKASASYLPGSPTTKSSFGPSQVALVLAFYSDRNIPGQRGHIYLGPQEAAMVQAYRPGDVLMGYALDLGQGLFDIGGQNVKHVIHSPTHNTYPVVHNYWVDDRWDTQRRRLPKPSKRVTAAP